MSLPSYEHPINSFDYDVYSKYLESSKWNKLRNKRLVMDDFKCVICGNPHNLQVHHLLYPTVLGTEHITHLVTLCEPCHKAIEGRKKSSTRDNKAQQWYSRARIWVRFKTGEEFLSAKDDLIKHCTTGRDGYPVIVFLQDERQRICLESETPDGYYFYNMTLCEYRKLAEQGIYEMRIEF